jgi:hypothetical protein
MTTKKTNTLISIVTLIVGVCILGFTIDAQATRIFDVTLDTSQLGTLHPGASFAVDFQLNDGSGGGDGNNTATLSNFLFGGGSAGGAPALFGGASGSLASGIAIIDNAFLNEFLQGFTPGASLSFRVNLTTAVDAGPTPDQFSFSLTETGAAPSFFDTLIKVDINSATPAIQTFSASGNNVTITPLVQIVQTQPVPEPITVLLLLTGMIVLAAARRKWS